MRNRVPGLMGMEVTTEATAIASTPIPDSAWALPSANALKGGGKEMKDAMKGKH